MRRTPVREPRSLGAGGTPSLALLPLLALSLLLGCAGDGGPVTLDSMDGRSRAETADGGPKDFHDAAEDGGTDLAQDMLEPGDLADGTPEVQALCGDGICFGEAGEEDCSTCPEDCGECPVCGNGVCEFGYPKEGWLECPEDCGWCGDATCSLNELPQETFCNKDCGIACGDGVCAKGEGTTPGTPGFCPVDCGGCYDGVCGYRDLLDPDLADCKDADCAALCGDSLCENNESPDTCPFDCPACGDGVCAILDGTPEACPADCLAPCGDGLCTGGETPESCPQDCGPCGDGICSWKEAELACCWADCAADCGDGSCQTWEDEATCPVDCACKPACNPEWQCGQDDNGCGEPCGGCPTGIQCIDHVCCVPACKGAVCGNDGCGGSCGQCPEAESCVNGQCLCTPLCAGNVCGADGCGGSCGECSDDLICTVDSCYIGDCQYDLMPGFCLIPLDTGDGVVSVCVPEGAQRPNYPCEACLPQAGADQWSPVNDGAICGVGKKCYGGNCCSPALACAGMECGDSGCGSCGTCEPDHECVDGACVLAGCEPQCAGLQCGDDGCGGTCGECDDGLDCTADECLAGQCTHPVDVGQCVVQWGAQTLCLTEGTAAPGDACQSCQPDLSQSGFSPLPEGTLCGPGRVCHQGSCCDVVADCLNKECGVGGCGESCGECGAGYLCVDHLCLCQDSCAGKQCGTNACGESCGLCPANYDCLAGVCVCVPDCLNKACGDDGCGGSCGSCDDGLDCTADTCWADQLVPGKWSCGNTFVPESGGYCLIDGVCVVDGATKPGYPCRECDTAAAWSYLQLTGDATLFMQWAQYGCVINDQCVTAGATNPLNECERCDVELDAAGWSYNFNGTPCEGSGICLDGTCCHPGNVCDGLECGDDGCGGSCGTCGPGIACATDYGKCGVPCDDGNTVDWDGCTGGFGGETQVNQVTADVQSEPAVATFPDGTFVVVWHSREANGFTFRISGRLFAANGTPLTDEFQVNAHGSGSQRNAAVATFPDGRFVAAWEGAGPGSSLGVFARVFAPYAGPPDVAPSPLTQDLPVSVLDVQSKDAEVVTLTQNRFAVLFAHTATMFPSTPDWNVYARVAEDPGTGWAFLAEASLAHTSPLGDQQHPSAASFGADGFVAAWESCPGGTGADIDAEGCAILGRGFDIDGMPRQAAGVPLDETLLNLEEAYDQYGVDVAAHAFDDYVAVWYNKVTGYVGTHLTGRPLDGFEAQSTPDFFVNDPTLDGHWKPAVAARPDGSLVVVWESWSTGGNTDYEVLARILAGNGVPVADSFTVNLYTAGQQLSPDVATFQDGSMVVAWVSSQAVNEPESAAQDGDDQGIYVRRYRADGTPCPAHTCVLPEVP